VARLVVVARPVVGVGPAMGFTSLAGEAVHPRAGAGFSIGRRSGEYGPAVGLDQTLVAKYG